MPGSDKNCRDKQTGAEADWTSPRHLNPFLLQVFNLSDGALLSVIDSHGSKLKRPTGLAVR